MPSSATGSGGGGGGVSATTTKSSSGIEVETPGLQWAVSAAAAGRSFGSLISNATDCSSSSGVQRRFEIWTSSEADYRYYLEEWVELLEEVKQDFGVCFQMPPPRMVRYRDLFERAWGWERLCPAYNLRYLEEFYWRNARASGAQSDTTLGRQPSACATAGVNLVYLRRKKIQVQQDANSARADHNLAIILVYLCCQKEAELISEWKKQGLHFASPEIRLSTRIQKEIITLVLQSPIPVIPPVIYDCINCITKEAGLILEWLRLGFRPCGFHHDLSHDIRTRVFRLIKEYSHANPCSASVAICAVLLGIAKESALVSEKLRQEDDILGGENSLSLDIRTSALDLLYDVDVYVLKRARIDGFSYRVNFDPAAADIPTCERERRCSELHVDGAHESSKENHSTKNPVEEDLTVTA